jgi:16S rRNA (guanine527-N7)-methyltransferase
MTREALKAAGHDLDIAAVERLSRFVHALEQANRQVNLTAAKTAEAIWHPHVLDSLALLHVMGPETTRALDLGSGGGLPGLPLACARPDVDVTLLEAIRKKHTALQDMIDQLGLTNARPVCGRAESQAHAPALRERFNLVTARAVAALPVLLELAAGFTRVGGVCWFFKSRRATETELPAATAAAAACGLVPIGTRAYRLPREETERVLVGFVKRHQLSPDLPRRVGRPHKKPL